MDWLGLASDLSLVAAGLGLGFAMGWAAALKKLGKVLRGFGFVVEPGDSIFGVKVSKEDERW